MSVYRNLLFVSGEGLGGRLDCGTQGVKDTVSKDRLRGLRIFDISDINNPKNVGNVQTCRGSHTHTVLVDPKDPSNVYVYISGSAGVRSPNELAGCVEAHARQGSELGAVPHRSHQGAAGEPRGGRDRQLAADLQRPHRAARGTARRRKTLPRSRRPSPRRRRGAVHRRDTGLGKSRCRGFIVNPMLDSIVKARNGTGAPTAADSAALRAALPAIDRADGRSADGRRPGPRPGPTQCHDITVYPAIGLAGGACEGYGLLLDIRDPVNPVRIAAVADSNFSYWHSATFNNDGTKILFSDEWGGGGQAKCRVTDKREWGANAIFTIVDRKMHFQELLQAAGCADPAGELRGPQRLADSDSGPRRDGAGVVSGRHLGLRLDRSEESEGDRVLRSRSGGLDQNGRRRILVGVLVQRRASSARRSRAGSTSSS